MTLKIALISDAWRPQINGVVTTVLNTCKTLRAAGHQVLLVTPDQFKSFPCPTYPSIKLAYWCGGKLTKQLDDFQPDRIHIATEGPLGLAARRYCLKRKLTFTTSFHTLFPEYIHMRFKFPVAWGYQLLRWFHAPAAKMMVPTSTMEKRLRARGFNNHMVHWSRGVDADLFCPRNKDFLAEPRPIAMYVGRVTIEKGIEDFLSLDLPGSKVVVGDGPQLSELRAKYPQTVFVGLKTGIPLAQYMAAADVFVFPSRTDTFGIVMLDALACGVPVAAYPVPGPQDILLNEQVGCTEPDLKQAILKALSLNSRDCRNYAKQYTWQSCTEQFLNNLVPAQRQSSIDQGSDRAVI